MRSLLALALLWLAFSQPADAQRHLSWDALDVDALLAQDGTLHVTERQAMVFTGDWNGGERAFNLRPRQRLGFEGMERLDTGQPMVGVVTGCTGAPGATGATGAVRCTGAQVHRCMSAQVRCTGAQVR